MSKKQPPLEKEFQARLLIKLREIPRTHWFKIHDQVTAGIPDILGSVGGVFVGIEVKTRSKVKPIQAWTLRKIEESKGHAFVATPDNYKEIIEFIKKVALLAEAPNE